METVTYQGSKTYKVDLPVFEGPLDLLLHLIRKNDLDIANIPINPVLEQYLTYLQTLQELNIDLAGEFILMAAELSYIKSKMLLPIEKSEEEEEGIDPRADLARRLLEYQRYKEAAQWLRQKPLLGHEQFLHPPIEKENVPELPPLPVNSIKLLLAWDNILKRSKPEIIHQIRTENLSVTRRLYEILDEIQSEFARFENLFKNSKTRTERVVTFLAILELIRLKLAFLIEQNHSLTLQKSGEKPEQSEIDSEFDTEEEENSHEQSVA